MAKIILLFIISLGLQVASADLDAALQSFLTSIMENSFVGNKANSTMNLHKLYKTKFNRTSTTENEENLRFMSFNNTLHAILDHHRQNNKTYTLGLNDYSDWTQDELNKLRSGIQIPQDKINETNAKPGDRLLRWDGKSLQRRAVIQTSYDLTAMVVSGTNVPVVSILFFVYN